MIKYLKDENFNEEINCDFLLVDFFADWCGPCKALGEILEMMDNVDILKVNVDEHSDIAAHYGVMSIPTIFIFKNGQEVAKHIGMLSKEELQDFINNNK